MKVDFQHKITKAIAPIVFGMCAHPNECVISEDPNDGLLTITVSPHMADYRVICGKAGKTINGLKYIVEKCGQNIGEYATLDLVESFRGDKEDDRPFVFNPDFDEKLMERNINRLVALAFKEPPITEVMRLDDKLKYFIRVKTNDDVTMLNALDAVIWPYGYNSGQIIEVRNINKKDESRNDRAGTFPR